MMNHNNLETSIVMLNMWLLGMILCKIKISHSFASGVRLLRRRNNMGLFVTPITFVCFFFWKHPLVILSISQVVMNNYWTNQSKSSSISLNELPRNVLMATLLYGTRTHETIEKCYNDSSYVGMTLTYNYLMMSMMYWSSVYATYSQYLVSIFKIKASYFIFNSKKIFPTKFLGFGWLWYL